MPFLPPILPPIQPGATPPAGAGPQPPGPAVSQPIPLIQTAAADKTRVATSKGRALVSQNFVEMTGVVNFNDLAKVQAQAQKQQADQASIDRLKAMKPADLHKITSKSEKEFFRALLPAALESERLHGAPAVMTLVQAAVESDFARSPIGGYNIFGIKGAGPAGSVKVRTREVIRGRSVYVKANFAKYHNFYEAVSAHGKLYNNGNYDKAMRQYAKDKDAMKFIDNVAGIYATDPAYARTLKARIEEYGLLEMVKQGR